MTTDLQPDSIEVLASQLAAASAEDQLAKPVGGGTHQSIGYQVHADVAISTKALDAVVDYQPEDLTMTVQAGITVAEAESLANRDRRTTVLPEHPGTATVGGTIAAGQSGHLVCAAWPVSVCSQRWSGIVHPSIPRRLTRPAERALRRHHTFANAVVRLHFACSGL